MAAESAGTPRVKAPRPRARRPVARQTTPAGRFLPGTQILATPANQAVLAVVTRYRQALVALNPKGLLALAHPAYHDGVGTPSPHDDIRYADLARNLQRRLGLLRAIRIQLAVHALRWQGKKRVSVEVHSTLSFRTARGGGAGPWIHKSDSHLIKLALHKGTWLITSGL